MKKENVFTFFNSRFKAVSRPLREQLLCSMIRVNYGTSWDGDLDILKKFFPEWYHNNLVFGGLANLIETLSPSSDDETDPGIRVEEPTLLEGLDTQKLVLDKTDLLGEQTTDIPFLSEQTLTFKNKLA